MSKYFKRAEFACKCGCGFAEPHPYLLETLDAIREYVGRPILVNSGCRCEKHNSSPQVGGAKNSQHVKGRAADIRCREISAGTLWQKINELQGMGKLPRLRGLGRYDSFVHVDVRETPSLVEWDYRKRK